MSKITWLELYNFLHETANNIHKHGTFDWQNEVTIYDSESDSTKTCDTYYLTDTNGSEKFVLMTNMEKI